MIDVPARLSEAAATNVDTAAWLTNLPALLQRLLLKHDCGAWEQIKSDWSILLRACTDQGEVIYIKACPPNHETTSAIVCLLGNTHPQLVRCLFADVTAGVQILENVQGNPFSPDDNDEMQLAKVGRLLKALHSLNPDPRMITLESWCNDLINVANCFPVSITRNISRCNALLESAKSSVWLHGDLHHANIIRSDISGMFVAIDPHGIYGDASFDICTFIRNHVPLDLDDNTLRTFLERRILMIAKAAGYPLDRAFAWAAAGNALSLVWDLPSSGELLTDEHRHLNRILLYLNALADDYSKHLWKPVA